MSLQSLPSRVSVTPCPGVPGVAAEPLNVGIVWDAENRLTEVRQGPATLASFVYDGIGRRQQKTADGVTHAYVWDLGSLLEERLGTGQALRYVEGRGIDQHLAMQDGSTATYYLADHLGSVVQETNANGVVTLARRYDPWGNLLAGPSAGWAFTGREWDPETGLYYYRARYHDSKAGRFISEDPIGLEGGVNNYVYVGNSPALWIDPTGLHRTWQDIWWWIRDPVAGEAKRHCAERAEKVVVRQFGADWEGARSNAFKHCFWSCCISKKVGACRAERQTTAHEDYPGNPPQDKNMDLYNNYQGLSRGVAFPEQGCRSICLSAPERHYNNDRP